MCDDNTQMNNIGISGGLVLSVCLIPQIYKVIKTKKTEDISYIWQLMYIIGLILNLIYSLHYYLIPIYIPTIIELFFIIILTLLKCVYTRNKAIVHPTPDQVSSI